MDDLDIICRTLDKLTLDSLTLMEEYIQLKLSLEDTMKDGEMHLAKSRYIMGHANVSALQIPAEDSNAFTANTVVNSEYDKELGYRSYDIEVRDTKDDQSAQEPLKWFGVLVPQNLHMAQKTFKTALSWINQIVNIQARLDYTCNKIDYLKEIKYNLRHKGSEE